MASDPTPREASGVQDQERGAEGHAKRARAWLDRAEKARYIQDTQAFGAVAAAHASLAVFEELKARRP